MKYVYTEKDLDLISWDRIDQFIDKIYLDVNKYIEENNLKIKWISPILRAVTLLIFEKLYSQSCLIKSTK